MCAMCLQPTTSSLLKATSNLLVTKISDAVVNLKNWISLVLSKPLKCKKRCRNLKASRSASLFGCADNISRTFLVVGFNVS